VLVLQVQVEQPRVPLQAQHAEQVELALAVLLVAAPLAVEPSADEPLSGEQQAAHIAEAQIGVSA